MKVVHLVPSMESGGVEQVVLELGKAFSAQGIDNVVISSGGRLVQQLEDEGSRHVTMPIGRKSLATLFQIGKLSKVLTEERPDIVHIHSRVPAWVGFPACRRLPESTRPRVVTTVHGFYSVNFYSAVMAKGERVIAVSESIRDYVLANYPAAVESIVRVIPNAINPGDYYRGYRPPDEWMKTWREQYPELDGKFTLCLPGRLTRIKGQLDLIPILTTLNAAGIPAHAVIVGEAKKGKLAYREELLKAYGEAGISGQVSWAGHRSDLREILAACDVTLSLSTSPESFGKTTLESLALGSPVAGYAHGGVGEQLRRIFPEGRVAPGDTDAITKLIMEWYRSRPVIQTPVPQDYLLDGMIRNHLDVYRELLESTGPSRACRPDTE